MTRPLVKVCGNKYRDVLPEICSAGPDYMGFILHPDSPRGVSVKECRELVSLLPAEIKTVGVFVSSQLDSIKKIQQELSFSFIQLHGGQDPDFIASLRKSVSAQIIKVFPVDSAFDFSECEPFKENSDFFLFDTKGKLSGGNGVPFDWSKLSGYTAEVPFLLAGGISIAHVQVLKNLFREIPALHGFDINSGFETAPGRKDAALVASFIEGLKEQEADE